MHVLHIYNDERKDQVAKMFPCRIMRRPPNFIFQFSIYLLYFLYSIFIFHMPKLLFCQKLAFDFSYFYKFSLFYEFFSVIIFMDLTFFFSASDTNENYYPMLFSTDSMLEEMYSVCIQLVNKTWKEMRATSRDFSRVFTPLAF